MFLSYEQLNRKFLIYRRRIKNTQKSSHSAYRKRRLRWRKDLVLFCSIVMLLVGVVGGSMAYLLTKTDSIVNKFTPVQMSVDVHEEFDEKVKEHVIVKNTSDVPAFIRAIYTAYWQNEDGTVNGAPATYTIQIGEGWQEYPEDTDVYYYKGIVAAKIKNGILINSHWTCFLNSASSCGVCAKSVTLANANIKTAYFFIVSSPVNEL